ncbi:MAG: triose-phosphate isomerase [Helicobacter sp.]|nr:triose-phosphate isomerase [Helicobacter sp.]
MIIAANFKMHLTPRKLATFAATLRESLDSRLQILLFPNTACLANLPQCPVRWGAQNAYPAQNGAFSGEIGAEVLESLAIQTLLVGHSERRALGESQDFCAQKCRFYAELGFMLVYCIGEPHDVRARGRESVRAFLGAQLQGIPLDYPNLIIAYEPIWAIGTQAAGMEQIEQTHADIRALCAERGATPPLLYGGSVKPNNARAILSLSNVNGVLVGSAALVVSDFVQIMQAGLQAL